MPFNLLYIKSVRSCRLFIVVLLLPVSLSAQLRADFFPDKTGGCSPVRISFSNTTAGASASASWYWDFGNGNTSVLQNPGALFLEEKTYTVTLTVKDGAQSSQKTQVITVYKKPTVDFSAASPNICLPASANFTSNVTPGDGAISAYLWDFGDGMAQQAGGSTINHFYNRPQTATVSLTALNSYGCSNTIVKNNVVTIHPALNAGFTADRTIVCDAPGLINFTNTSNGPGTLTYLWDFGDNTKSTDASPAHTYTHKGTYKVKLTVTNSLGCSAVSEIADFINVGNFTSDFTVPSLLCTNGNLTFLNNSNPVPASSVWEFDGVNTYTSFNNYPVNYAFADAGTHSIKLTNNFGPCQQTITKQVEVHKKPDLNGFMVDITGLCGSPVKVNFRDTTADAVQWKWNLDTYGFQVIPSAEQAPSYVYTQDREYYVSLEVKNAAGCTANIAKPVSISKPIVGIFLQPGSITDACETVTVKFDPRSTEAITNYQWDFGDGNFSSEEEPAHTWTKPGTYTVALSYTTVNGCRGTAYYNSIYVRQTPKANFTVQQAVCGNTPVHFNNISTGYATGYIWDYGDNSGINWNSNLPHQYQQEGDYDVTLIAYNGMCNDTIRKNAIIKVAPPFPNIGGITRTCAGGRGEIGFGDASRLANSWSWDFGDGTGPLSYTVERPEVNHTYTRSGIFTAVLTTTNGACTVKDSVRVNVLLKQKPLLTLNTASICSDGGSVSIEVSNLERPPFDFYFFYNYRFVYGDGTPFTGNVSFVRETPFSAILSGFTPGKEGLQVITTSYFGCEDTSNIASLKVKGAAADFNVLVDNVCFKNAVVMEDRSTAQFNIPLVKWEWIWGDGNTTIGSNGNNVSHIYANPGSYHVSLRVTDAEGCSSFNGYRTVNVTGPKAAFSMSGSTVPLSTNVAFYNNTNSYNSPATTYAWTFGSAGTSYAYSPSFTFNTAGQYNIKLIARNPDNGCADTTEKTIEVKNFNSGFTTSVSFIGDYNKCPPVLARFTNTSSGYTRLVWDFGDGATLENNINPLHVYKDAGTYVVTLYVYGFNGLTGTYKDTVFASAPSAVIQADDLDGCIGHKLVLNAPVHNNAATYIWDFGNGHLINATDSFATHQYMAAGSYTASLLVMNTNGCLTASVLPDKIQVYPDPVISISPLAPVVCKNNGVQLQASGAVSYAWSPATGLNDASIANPLALPGSSTTYSVNATDNHGCSSSAAVTVKVAAPFEINLAASTDVCKGNTVTLNPSGAQSWQWINNISSLSSTQVRNPLAAPAANTIYTVVGFDEYDCYSDTADIQVMVRPLPVVNAGPDLEVVYGSDNQLMATGSADIVRWNWTPPDFLSCTNCPSPVSRPYDAMEYVVTAYNQYDCMAKDSVKLKTFCTDGYIHIPTAFTPNRDGKNDLFTINGYGVRIINSLRIYNRWGEIVFEKKNFHPNDMSAAWNGKLKGVDVPVGAYVYFAEMECNMGEKFQRKGTVTLVR